jgi:cytochrome c
MWIRGSSSADGRNLRPSPVVRSSGLETREPVYLSLRFACLVRTERRPYIFAVELNVMQTYARIASSSVALLLLCAAVSLAGAADAGTSGDSGQVAFNNNCRTCHSTKDGDNRIGPSLSHIVGTKAGARSGFANYSQAMKTAGITWDEQTLDRFIASPESVVPNNNMKPFKGVVDAAVRKAIIEYLKSE